VHTKQTYDSESVAFDLNATLYMPIDSLSETAFAFSTHDYGCAFDTGTVKVLVIFKVFSFHLFLPTVTSYTSDHVTVTVSVSR
jgi:hypothetical protein